MQERINYTGDLTPLLDQACADYNIGHYISHEVVLVGYEDFNLIVRTDSGKYFFKLYASFRDLAESQWYVDIMERVIQAGVHHPSLLRSAQGSLYEQNISGELVRLCVMQFIDGKSFYQLQAVPTHDEFIFLVEQAARINKIDFKPVPIYDSWAVVNFLSEYKQKGQYLDGDDRRAVEALVERFSELVIEKLPHALVHGDIIKTNVMRDVENKLWILDFSVANYYPRIQELAVLLCNLLFDERNPGTSSNYYNLALSEYQKYIHLTPEEIEVLPLFVQVAHAMHILCPTYEKKVKGNNSDENEYWLSLGRKGLSVV